jgi:hypothetical protein
MKFLPWLTGVLSLAMLAGCATDSPRPTPRLTGDPLTDGNEVISHGPAKDRVLWQYRTALAALHRGRFAEAKRLLDDALLSVGGITTDAAARQARSYFHGEDRKKFIGEPYERVMAYYYRGILYWMDGEPDNARACFRSAQLQDADAENHDYAADYVLLDYLDGLAATKLGEDGSDSLQRAQKESKFGAPVPYDKKANVLFFIEFGGAPFKYATGEYRQELRFAKGTSPVASAQVRMENRIALVTPYDDLYFQATTRGGRVMDHILANKAIFKTTTDAVGDAAIISGAILAGTPHSRHSDAGNVGLGLLAFGAASKIVSGFTTPAADVRSWDNLPQFLSFTALPMAPGPHSVTIEFKDAQGHVLPSLTKSITINVTNASRDTVVFVSDRSATPQAL